MTGRLIEEVLIKYFNNKIHSDELFKKNCDKKSVFNNECRATFQKVLIHIFMCDRPF